MVKNGGNLEVRAHGVNVQAYGGQHRGIERCVRSL